MEKTENMTLDDLYFSARKRGEKAYDKDGKEITIYDVLRQYIW